MNNRPSFEKIDYTIRPAKCIERKMIGEMIGSLRAFQPINEYVYIGLGSTFFTDFVLYHKMFGIHDMFSIEKEETKRQRIEFNIPFECIKVQYGETTDVLSRLNWQSPSIVWMDYDKGIDYRKQDDIIFLSQNLQSSSLLMVTVRTENTDFDKRKSPPNLDVRLESLRDSLHNKIPDLTKYEVGDLGKAIQIIFTAAISEALAQANSGKPEVEKINFHQVEALMVGKDVTLTIQQHNNCTPEKLQPLFDKAYELYVKYEVETS